MQQVEVKCSSRVLILLWNVKIDGNNVIWSAIKLTSHFWVIIAFFSSLLKLVIIQELQVWQASYFAASLECFELIPESNKIIEMLDCSVISQLYGQKWRAGWAAPNSFL